MSNMINGLETPGAARDTYINIQSHSLSFCGRAASCLTSSWTTSRLKSILALELLSRVTGFFCKDIDDFEDLYLDPSFFEKDPHGADVNAFLGRTFADIEEKGKPRFIVYNVRVDAAGLVIEYYSADLKGVPRSYKERHWCHYEANKHWIEWVDDGLSERADVGSKKARAALPASLR